MFRYSFHSDRRGDADRGSCGHRHMRGARGHGPDHGIHDHSMRGRRHGGGGRMLDQGDLRLVLLRLLAEQPRHGYELIKAIEALTGGAYTPSPGVVYPTLTMLEEQGLTIAAAADGKKQYTPTAEGLAELEANRAQADAIFARFAGAEPSANLAPLLRAMGNLKLALRLRLSGGPIPEERIRAIAAAIDAAAGEAER
jgi:DNA-binding PadR family transcriptional regulator